MSSADTQKITLFLAGDVMTGRGIDQVLPHSVNPVLYEPYVKNAKHYVRFAERHSGPIPNEISYEYMWGEALVNLQQVQPDARIINLETAVTTYNEPWPNKQIHYRMHPGNAPLFTKTRIDACVLGNNHVMDWNEEGLIETVKTLERQGLQIAGAGLNAKSASEPAILETERGRILLFSYTTHGAGTPKRWQAGQKKPGVNFLEGFGSRDAKRVETEVDDFRQENDRVLVSLHWGSNWGYEIPNSQQTFAHRLIDRGVADLIYGHSSHHPRGIEVYKNRLILYGCGDLINDYEGISGHEEYRRDLSLMYFPTLDSKGRLKSLRMIPMKIQRFSLTNPSKSEVKWMSYQLTKASEEFGTTVERTNEGDLKLQWENGTTK